MRIGKAARERQDVRAVGSDIAEGQVVLKYVVAVYYLCDSSRWIDSMDYALQCGSGYRSSGDWIACYCRCYEGTWASVTSSVSIDVPCCRLCTAAVNLR